MGYFDWLEINVSDWSIQRKKKVSSQMDSDSEETVSNVSDLDQLRNGF